MKRILLITAFTLLTTLIFAQENSKSDSKWKSSVNGQSYQMAVSSTTVSTKSTEKPTISFSIKGSDKHLTKVVLTGKELSVALPISKASQSINLNRDLYKIKFYHEKLGLQEFEVNLKNGVSKSVLLTLNKTN